MMRPLILPAAVAERLRSDGWSVAVTGAGGWVGQALLEQLLGVYEHAFGSRVAAFGSVARRARLRGGRELQIRPLGMMGHLNPGRWLVAHCAYATRDKVSAQGNDAFIRGNEALRDTVTSAMERLKPQAIFFPSSGAVYAKHEGIDNDLDANPYGVLKHRDEQHFSALAKALGARVALPRVFNISGPYINKWHAYALSDFILQARSGAPPVIHAPHAVWRSYLHVGDMLAVSLAVLLDDAPGPTVFDTSGECEIELAALAARITALLRPELSSAFRTPDAALAANRYVGAREPIAALCARHHITPLTLDEQIRDTAHYLEAAAA